MKTENLLSVYIPTEILNLCIKKYFTIKMTTYDFSHLLNALCKIIYFISMTNLLLLCYIICTIAIILKKVTVSFLLL